MGSNLLIAIGALIIVILLLSYSVWVSYKNKQKSFDDRNVEWFGDQVDLKKKNYPVMQDDYREEIQDAKH